MPAHITGDTAVNTFKSRCPQEWSVNDVQKDYGWDLLVTITSEGTLDQDFLVQMKGSEHPDYVDNDRAVTQVLKTATVRWLLDKPMPIMLCICDTRKPAKPVYWVWLNESVKEIEKKSPDWLQQQTITVRVPTSQTIDKSCKEQIETYVREFCVNLNISKEISEVIGPAFQIEKPQVREAYARDPHEFVQQKIIPPLADAGIVEPTGEALSKEDQKRFRKIKEASTALNEFHDLEAKAVLDQLDTEIDTASEGVKARYYNNKGVLAVHNNDLQAALRFYQSAHEKRPSEVKYTTNLLSVEFELAQKDSSGHKQLPTAWENRLESVLSKSPDFAPALRLKAYWLGHSKGATSAENLLRNKPLWQEEPLACSIVLGEVYMHEGNLEKAIDLLVEREHLGSKLDGIYWTVYGLALFRKSVHLTDMTSGVSVIEGPGPREMDMVCMEKARECYAKAFAWFESKAMPRLAQPTIVNYAAVLGLLDRYAESELVCDTYLRHHPGSQEVQSGLAQALFFQQEYGKAIPLLEDAYRARPTCTTEYKNLLLCLFFAEEYEQLFGLFRERLDSGFLNTDEEGLSRSLAAVASFELGNIAESRKQIEFLKTVKALAAEAAITDASVAKRSGVPKEEAVDIIRTASRQNPDSLRLLSHLALNLAPATPDNAEEIEKCLRKIYERRHLIPEEFSLLGSALIILGKPEKAEQVFRQASIRYPTELRFLCDRADALVEIGDEERALEVLQFYLIQGQKSYSVLRNMAVIAADTGRLQKSIQFFQMALGKTRDEKDAGEIHCQLHELKKRRRDPPKDILRHVVEYGRMTHGKPESEVRYLGMFFVAPVIPEANMDDEAREWVKDFQTRLHRFSNKYPDHAALKTLRMPTGLSHEEMGEHFLAQLAGIMLPQYLRTVPLQLAVRNQRWPLAFRAQYLPGSLSIFEYWHRCVTSKEFGYGIHIFSDVNNLNREFQVADRANAVCIDLTALLTLAQLGLLDTLSNSFKQIIIARGTKITIEQNLFGIQTTHPLGQKIDKWRLANRSIIRIRNARTLNRMNRNESGKDATGLWVKNEPSLDVQLGSGVGETLLLAQELQLPLYSDESILRHWAERDYQVAAFSTLAFIKKLVAGNLLTYSECVDLNARMIQMNFRTIRIEVSYLNTRLKELIILQRKGNRLPTNSDLLNDHILGVFLRQFGETTVNPDALGNLAVEWWKSVLFDQTIPTLVLPECMQYPSYALSMRTSGGVLSGISATEPLEKTTILWAAFLWRCYRKNDKFTRDAWSALKSSCSRIFPDERKQAQVLFELLPKWLGIIVEKDVSLSEDQKMSCLVSLPLSFEEHERIKFEKYFLRHPPRFLR